MAGPRLLGINNVVNPYDDLQKSINQVGDIYRNYEQDRRVSEEHEAKMAEVERQKNAREYLRNYNADLGGADFRGIDEDTRKSITRVEAEVLKGLGPNATPDEYRKVAADLAGRRSQLATREAVTSTIYNDMLRNGVDPQTAASFAANQAAKYQSVDSVLAAAREGETGRSQREIDLAKLAIEAAKARKPPSGYKAGGSSTGGKSGNSGSTGDKPYELVGATEEFLKEHIGGWIDMDTGPAVNNINKALILLNEDRRKLDKPPVSLDKLTNVISSAVTSGKTDNDVIYQSSAKWKDAFEKYIEKQPQDAFGGYGASGYKGNVEFTDKERAVINRAFNSQPNPLTRAQVVEQRVRTLYSDLLGTKGPSTSGTGTTVKPAPTVTGGTGRVDLSTQESRLDAVRSNPQASRLDQESLNSEITTTNRRLSNMLRASKGSTTPEISALRQRLSELEGMKEVKPSRIDQAYGNAVNNGLGTLVPQDVYTGNLQNVIRNYSPQQMQDLLSKVRTEAANYAAMEEFARRNGNTAQATSALRKQRQLQAAAGYLNSRLK